MNSINVPLNFHSNDHHGSMLPQKILKIRCSEMHFGALSGEIEKEKKVVKK